MPEKKTRNSQKGPKTRELIFETAIALFQRQGFDQTTMRDIATASGVALGNTYYYFRSKEHLVLALYEHTLELQLSRIDEILARETAFPARLQAVLQSNIEVLQPYNSVLRALFRLAGDPTSSLNPFGTETHSIRIRAQSIFARIAQGTDKLLSPAVRADLPEFLWLCYMGIILFWLYDQSPECTKTQKLISRTSELSDFILSIAAIPMMNKVLEMVAKMLNELRH